MIYHVMVGPAVLTFVKELGEFYGSAATRRSSASSTRSRRSTSTTPGLEFLEGTHFWEGQPRYRQPDAAEQETLLPRSRSASTTTAPRVGDAKDVSTYAHMFSAWETLFVIKQAMEAAGYKGAGRPPGLRRGDRGDDRRSPPRNEHPQGDKIFNGKTHQVFGHQNISKVEGGKLDGRAHHLDRGRALPRRGRLHDACRSEPRRRHVGLSARSSCSRRLEGLVMAAVLALTARRPLPRLRRDAGRQRRPWRVLHARRRRSPGSSRSLVPAPPGARLPRRPRPRPLVAGAVALVADRLVLRRLDYEPEAVIVATIGLVYILQQGALSFYGPDARPVAAPFDLPHPAPLVRLFRLQARGHRRRRARSSPRSGCC